MDNLKIRQYQYLYNLIRLLPEELEASKIEKLVFLDQLDKKEFIYTDYVRWYFGAHSSEVLEDIKTLQRLLLINCNEKHDEDGDLIYKKISVTHQSSNKISGKDLLLPNFSSKAIDVFFNPIKYSYSHTLERQFYLLNIDSIPLGVKMLQCPHDFQSNFHQLVDYFKEYKIPLKSKINEEVQNNIDYLLLVFVLGLILVAFVFFHNGR